MMWVIYDKKKEVFLAAHKGYRNVSWQPDLDRAKKFRTISYLRSHLSGKNYDNIDDLVAMRIALVQTGEEPLPLSVFVVEAQSKKEEAARKAKEAWENRVRERELEQLAELQRKYGQA